MKLYYSPGACSLSPHIVLHESGLPFSTEKVSLKTKLTASGADYLAINSKGYVPALELDDGQLLTEGPAIVQYVADLVPERGLVPPPGGLERARLQEWLNFIATEIHKTFVALWHAAPEETRVAARERLEHWLTWLEAPLSSRSFLMGDGFTVADAYLFTVLNWTRFLKFPLDRWPAVAAYLARVAARPAVQAALHAEGLDA